LINNKLSASVLLPLIAASSVLRDYKTLRSLLSTVKLKRVKFVKIYEALLQNYLFAGYPSALVSLKLLKEFYPAKKLKKAADMNLYHFRKRGEINCKKVYGRKFDKLINNIKNFSPDLAEWLVLEGYGKVFGRKGLSFKERELCAVAVLTVSKFEEQLYSHLGGVLNAGATIDDIKELMKSLDLLIGKNHSKFGMKVLNRLLKKKRIK
jgi:alkylhydroperoxidase/carboxymuconolactone decarboxylase family protein YurZ